MKKLLSAALALCCISTALAAPPNFSGTYVLDPASAKPAQDRHRPIGIINIEQTAEKIVITEWYDKQHRVDSFECEMSGACVYNFGEGVPGQQGTTALSFEDAHLVIRSLRGSKLVMRRFVLSADKMTLSLKELQAKPATLVYRRE